MKSVNTLPYSFPPHFFTKCPLRLGFPQNSFSVKRRRSHDSRRNKHHQPFKKLNSNSSQPTNTFDYGFVYNDNNQNLKLVLDVNQISLLASSKFRQFLSSSQDAFDDLKTLITLDDDNRIVFSCRRSTLQFTAVVLLSGFVSVFAFRFLIKLGLGFKRRLSGYRNQNVVVRRDRSLGGREVIVGRTDNTVTNRGNVKGKSSWVLDNPLSPFPGRVTGSGLERDEWRSYRVRSQQKLLPKWWPVSAAPDSGLVVNQEEYQREANRLIRGWVKSLLCG